MAIFLCGFMGCGKTTIGKTLSRLLGCGYCDMDELIVKKAGMSIPEIFEKKGESYFRNMETELIKELGNFKGLVSCGGGAMLSDVLLKPVTRESQEIKTVRLLQAVPGNSFVNFTMKDIRNI